MGLTTDLHRTYKGTIINPSYISNIAICFVWWIFRLYYVSNMTCDKVFTYNKVKAQGIIFLAPVFTSPPMQGDLEGPLLHHFLSIHNINTRRKFVE